MGLLVGFLSSEDELELELLLSLSLLLLSLSLSLSLLFSSPALTVISTLISGGGGG